MNLNTFMSESKSMVEMRSIQTNKSYFTKVSAVAKIFSAVKNQQIILVSKQKVFLKDLNSEDEVNSGQTVRCYY